MKKIIKRLAIAFLFLVVVMGGCVFCFTPRPPKEAKLIQNFNEHRAAFEKLRDMLQADEQVTRVGSWGVATTKSAVPRIPPEGDLSVDRYNEYMALLKQVGGISAWRDKGKYANPEIVVWSWGWAGRGHCVAVFWLDQEPTNLVTNLDDYFRKRMYGRPGYRHIDENWYLGIW